MREEVLNYLLKLFVETHGVDFFKFISRDFVSASPDGMRTLFEAGKQNIIHDLCKCFTEQPGSNAKTRMPMDRMPYGLVDYNIRFFAPDFTQKLGVEEHYAKWMETIFSHFGHKWVALHRGPAWQYEIEDQAKDSTDSNIFSLKQESQPVVDFIVKNEKGNVLPEM